MIDFYELFIKDAPPIYQNIHIFYPRSFEAALSAAPFLDRRGDSAGSRRSREQSELVFQDILLLVRQIGRNHSKSA